MLETIVGVSIAAAIASFLFSYIGLGLLVLYFFVVAVWFEDDWWFKGLLFLAIPIWLAVEVGALGFPGWSGLAWMVAGYFGVGIIWSFFKWVILVTDLKKDVAAYIRSGTLHHNGYTAHEFANLPWNELENIQKAKLLWNQFFTYRGKYAGFVEETVLKTTLNITPTVSSTLAKARIFSWIAYWPFSLVKYIFERLLKDLVDFIIERLKGIYNLIAANIMRGFQV